MIKQFLILYLSLHTLTSLKCQKNIIESYGLEGLKTSKTLELNMCPEIRESCCEYADQLIIYNNWITSNEKSILEKHYQRFSKFYTKLMQIFLIASNKANEIVELQKTKSIGNCKLLAERILDFELETSYNDVLESLNNMESFFNISYSGFYCSICDAKNHVNIDVKISKLFFSKKFCRNMIENTLSPLMYIKSHLKILANLVSHFLSSCNFKGVYTIFDIPDDVVFVVNEEEVVELERCKKWRNEKDWYLFCLPVCKRFNMVLYEKYFEMDEERLESYLLYAKNKIQEIEDFVKKNPIQSNSRVLENEKKIKKVVKKDFSESNFGRILQEEENKKKEFETEKNNFDKKKKR